MFEVIDLVIPISSVLTLVSKPTRHVFNLCNAHI